MNNRWLDLQMFDQQPLLPKLSGLNLEYRIIQLYSRDAGQREAALSLEYVVRGGVRRRDAPRQDRCRAQRRPEVVTQGQTGADQLRLCRRRTK